MYGCFQNIVAGYAGDATKRCSAFLFGATRELPGGDLILPTSIVEALKSEIQGLDSKLRLGHKVSKIRWNQGTVDYLASFLSMKKEVYASLFPEHEKTYFDSFLSRNFFCLIPECLEKKFASFRIANDFC